MSRLVRGTKHGASFVCNHVYQILERIRHLASSVRIYRLPSTLRKYPRIPKSRHRHVPHDLDRTIKTEGKGTHFLGPWTRILKPTEWNWSLWLVLQVGQCSLLAPLTRYAVLSRSPWQLEYYHQRTNKVSCCVSSPPSWRGYEREIQ